MKNIKSGKEEIIYLLTKAIEKYNTETGQEIVQNTNRKNYESLAILLSQISNQLPNKAEEWGTDPYPPDYHPTAQEYPHKKYDITGGQIKDALSGIVSNPRPYLVDACYIYLYGKGRKAFRQDPVDDQLFEKAPGEQNVLGADTSRGQELEKRILSPEQHSNRKNVLLRIQWMIMAATLITTVVFGYLWQQQRNEWRVIKKDMNILPYQPTKAEIDSLEGVWLCYTGSPQARISDPTRYHKVVSNFIKIEYRNGYFTYDRYGASFNHTGYMQFESPGIVSVYSRIKNNSSLTESPRHSLINLNLGKKYLAAISTSWNFDIGDRNKIIGIREIYLKLGKAGRIEEVINEIENASCQCKIIRWHRADSSVKTFYLKNQLLDSLAIDEIKPLINENSILLGMPEEGLIISNDSLQ